VASKGAASVVALPAYAALGTGDQTWPGADGAIKHGFAHGVSNCLVDSPSWPASCTLVTSQPCVRLLLRAYYSQEAEPPETEAAMQSAQNGPDLSSRQIRFAEGVRAEATRPPTWSGALASGRGRAHETTRPSGYPYSDSYEDEMARDPAPDAEQLAAQLQAMYLSGGLPGLPPCQSRAMDSAAGGLANGSGVAGVPSELSRFVQRQGSAVPLAAQPRLAAQPSAAPQLGGGGYGDGTWGGSASTSRTAGLATSSTPATRLPFAAAIGPMTSRPRGPLPNGFDPPALATLLQSWQQLQRLFARQEKKGNMIRGSRAYRRLHYVKKKIEKRPLNVVDEHLADVRMRLGAEPMDLWQLGHMTDRVCWGRLPVSTEGGKRTTAFRMLPGHDPCRCDPYDCAEDDLHVIASCRGAQRRPERPQARREQAGDPETEQAAEGAKVSGDGPRDRDRGPHRKGGTSGGGAGR